MLGSQQCGLGSIPAWCHMWVEFVVGSRSCSECFSQCPEMQANEMHALHGKHHKVSSFLKSQQNTHNSVKYGVIWSNNFVMLIHKEHWISLACISGHIWLPAGSLVFFPPQKTNIFKFQFYQDRGLSWKPAKADMGYSLNIIGTWLLDWVLKTWHYSTIWKGWNYRLQSGQNVWNVTFTPTTCTFLRSQNLSFF